VEKGATTLTERRPQIRGHRALLTRARASDTGRHLLTTCRPRTKAVRRTERQRSTLLLSGAETVERVYDVHEPPPLIVSVNGHLPLEDASPSDTVESLEGSSLRHMEPEHLMFSPP
jgi:hypothetical protein